MNQKGEQYKDTEMMQRGRYGQTYA
jgi:hypothetical protein